MKRWLLKALSLRMLRSLGVETELRPMVPNERG